MSIGYRHMKHNITKKITLILIVSFSSLVGKKNIPQLTIILVIDQLAYNTLTSIRPHVRHGFKTLLEQGVVFTNAHHPHGMPATCTGHTALSTGAFGNEHGIVGNNWYDQEGNLVACDAADASNAAVIAPDGVYDYGKSFHYGMVDGITDQFVLCTNAEKPHHAYTVSLKSRAAIATANRIGIPIWFDAQSGLFTSSQAYVNSLPDWLAAFNKKDQVANPSSVVWNQKYPENSAAYRGIYHDNYHYIQLHKPLINTTIAIGSEVSAKNPYKFFVLTPHANKLVIDCATACMNSHISKDKPDSLLLWVCISSLDKLGHQYGPWSKEIFDMLYHLDADIQTMMNNAESLLDPSSILYVLTSDHGISPIVEQLNERGIDLAKRVSSKELVQKLNTYIEEEYGYTNLVHNIKGHQVYLNTNLLRKMEKAKQEKMIHDLQDILESYEGIKKAWTPEELSAQSFPPFSPEYYFKQQLFKPRSGSLIVQVYPYTIITSHPYGTSHKTPHTYNTHVPLILYQKGIIEKKQVHDKVFTLQLAPTLAEILQIPQPSAAYQEILPGILPEKQ